MTAKSNPVRGAPDDSPGSLRWILLGLWIAISSSAFAHGARIGRMALISPDLSDYHPQPVPAPKDHGYIMRDGSIRIVGCPDMAGMIAQWDALFSRTHPGIRFTPILKGNKTGIPAITYDMSAFAPRCGGATLLELLPYEKVLGSKKDPVAALIIRVAHGSLEPAAKLSPLGIIVNRSNPIASLNEQQAAAIFATGSGTGDSTNWSQLGMGGKLTDKPIHPMGLYWDAYQRPEDADMGEYMMYRKFGPFPGYVFSSQYQQFMRYGEVVDAVARDPLAIGLVALNRINGSVRQVPIVGDDGHTLTTGSEKDLEADRYPYARDLYIYIRREPGTPFDPLVREYMKLVLSKQGQEIVARDPLGYLPLSAADDKASLQRLERAKTWAPRSKQGPMLNFPFPSPQP